MSFKLKTKETTEKVNRAMFVKIIIQTPTLLLFPLFKLQLLSSFTLTLGLV